MLVSESKHVIQLSTYRMHGDGKNNRFKSPLVTPCGSCPYRKDVPSAIWDASEYQKLPSYDLDTMRQPLSVFLCHQQNETICAGWCGTHDMANNLGIRFALTRGQVDEATADACFDYSTDTPLFKSGADAYRHGMRDIAKPSSKAIAKQTLIINKRKRRKREA